MSLLLKTILLYASDSPELMSYFSHDFTKRLNENHVLEAYEDKNIQTAWMMNSLQMSSSDVIETQISEITKKLKSKSVTADQAQAQVEHLLEKNPIPISTPILTAFHFWGFLNSIHSYKSSVNHFDHYEKYASLAEKEHLESLVDLSMVKKIDTFSKKYPIKQRKIQILGPQNCLIYLNGKNIKSNTINLPDSMRSTISAVCSTGTFSTTFIPSQERFLKIEPSVEAHMDKMPPLSTLPKDFILQQNPRQLVLLYWSRKGHYMDCMVVNAKNFTTHRSIHLKLENPHDFDTVGDRLDVFLKNHLLNQENNSIM